MSASARAQKVLATLYPPMGPWTSAALWSGRATGGVPDAPLAAELEIVHAQKLSGLLLDFIDRSGAAVDTAHRDFLQRSTLAWMQHTSRAVHESTPALNRLRDSGIAFAVSKGPGLAAYYARPALRPFSDVDVIMSRSAFSAAAETLEQAGWREAGYNEQPRRYVRTVCREGLNLTHPGGGSIDLHHRIPPWLFSRRIGFAGVVQRSSPQTWAGVELPCLSPEDNLLVTALHVVSDRNMPGKSLMVWRDLVECVHHAALDDAVALASSAGLAGWVRGLLRQLPEAADVAGFAAEFPAQAVPAPRRLRMLLWDRLAALGVTGTQAMRLPAARAGAFVLAVAIPEREWLTARHGVTRHPYLEWWGGGGQRVFDRSAAGQPNAASTGS